MESNDEEDWSDSTAVPDDDSDEYDFGKDEIIFPPGPSENPKGGARLLFRSDRYSTKVQLPKSSDTALWKLSPPDGSHNRVPNQKLLPPSLQFPGNILVATKRHRGGGSFFD
jgi:hypothetical protein